MKLSTNPAVWRTAVGSIVAALVAAGVLGPELGDTINAVAGALLIAVTAILPVVGAIIAKSRTAPVEPNTPPATLLVRGSDGVYRKPDVTTAEAATLGPIVARTDPAVPNEPDPLDSLDGP